MCIRDSIKETLKTKHIDRLQNGRCSINSGLIFLELLNNFERIADVYKRQVSL